MFKRILMLSVLLILVLPLASCSLFSDPVYDDASPEDQGQYKKASRGTDPNACDPISSNELKDRCFERIAQKNKDVSICERIDDTESNDYCVKKVAEAKEDPELCEALRTQTRKDNCLANIVKKTYDSEQCAKIKSDNLKDNCYVYGSEYQANPEYCEENIKSSDSDFDDCMRKVAMNAKNIDYCEKIKDPQNVNSCFSRFASDEKKTDYCLKIGDATYKDNCITSIASQMNWHWECAKVGDKTKRAECFTTIARKMYDYDICDDIKDDPDARTKCLYAVDDTCDNFRNSTWSKVPENCQDTEAVMKRSGITDVPEITE